MKQWLVVHTQYLYYADSYEYVGWGPDKLYVSRDEALKRAIDLGIALCEETLNDNKNAYAIDDPTSRQELERIKQNSNLEEAHSDLFVLALSINEEYPPNIPEVWEIK